MRKYTSKNNKNKRGIYVNMIKNRYFKCIIKFIERIGT